MGKKLPLTFELIPLSQKPGEFFLCFRLGKKAIGHHNLRAGWTEAEVEALADKWFRNYPDHLNAKRLAAEILTLLRGTS